MKNSAWIGMISTMLIATATMAGCTSGPETDSDDDFGCEVDTDCRGDRVCDAGSCVANDAPPPNNDGAGGSSGDNSTGGNNTSGGGDAELVVSNATSVSVWYLYVASCSSTSWGNDQLRDNIISSGATFRLTAITPDCYDIRAETQAGNYWESRGNYFNGGESYTWTLTP